MAPTNSWKIEKAIFFGGRSSSRPRADVALQRIVTFLDWDSMAAELGITAIEGRMDRVMTCALH